ncbi:MAG: lamin tail domain-containing protein, partial [Gammaproteobacteria bacterium]
MSEKPSALSARRISIVACLAAFALALTAMPAQAEPAVRFAKIQYNSPGSDTGSNSSLNAEWVRITNHSSTNRVLSDWSIKDRAGYVFNFPTFTLKAGASVRVHTGSGTDSQTDLYWDRNWYVWNNAGDTAFLRKSGPTRVDRCEWGSGSGVKS